MTIIEFPHHSGGDHTASTANTAPSLSGDVVAHAPAVRHLALPRRFDVHQVPTIVDEMRRLGADRATVELDGSAVEMIDVAAMTSLDAIAEEIDLRISQPSTALRATVGYTGRESVAARFVVAAQGEVA